MAAPENIQFGKRLRELRKKKGLTQEQLAEKAGLHYKFIGRVERGTDIKLSNIIKIANGFEMSLSELFAFAFPKIVLSKKRDELLTKLSMLLESSSDDVIDKLEVFINRIL